MNQVIQAMKERRSIRAYTDEMPSREQIDQVIEAGLWAASGMNTQGPIIVAVTNRELRDRLSRMNAEVMGATDRDPFYGAPVVLVVLARCPQPRLRRKPCHGQPHARGACPRVGQLLDSPRA